MKFDEEIISAVGRALLIGVPFALCCLPGEYRPRFFAQNPSGNGTVTCGEAFEIGPWLTPFAQRLTIGSQLSPADVIAMTAPLAAPCCSTLYAQMSEEEYCSRVSRIIARCRERDGKTVYSRVIAGDARGLDIAGAARELFAHFPDTFRFLYSTPQTGCWLGASPETLIDADLTDNTFRTVSFAGTRPIECAAEPWDEKNIRENRFVADFFQEKFAALGIPYAISEPFSVDYGAIQHLCRSISGRLTAPLHVVIDAINPTPALCGSPAGEAIADIRDFEPQPRLCYGGFVALSSPRRFHAFVNLRCARIIPGRGFNIYAGGGITAASHPRDEYRETLAKASAIFSILTNRRHFNK